MTLDTMKSTKQVLGQHITTQKHANISLKTQKHKCIARGMLSHSYDLIEKNHIYRNNARTCYPAPTPWSATLSWWWGLCTDDPDDF